VPLNGCETLADLARLFGSGSAGGRQARLYQPTLLSAAIRSDGLALAGWVANQIDPGQARATENFATLAAMLEAPCIARVPWSDGASAQFMAAHLDLDALRKGAGTLTRRAML
jgi:dethiobiotin synthetase